jgi:hypothetical protein
MLPNLLSIAVACALSFTAAVAEGGIAVFTDRTAWETSAGGLPTIKVDFNSFADDTDLPVDLDPLFVSASQATSFIDAPALLIDVNGTSNFFMQFNEVDQAVFLVFDSPIFSFGADIRPATADVGESFTITADIGDIGTFTLPVDEPVFRGFISDEPFTVVLFQLEPLFTGSTAMAVDNVSAHTTLAQVPELSTILAWGVVIAFAGCCWIRRGRGASS